MHKKAHSHFAGQDAEGHIQETRSEAILETHGTEMPSFFAALADSARESAIALLLLWALFLFYDVSFFPALIAFSCGWLIWKTGRSAWLGWARLERLHRLIEQEKFEIEHHRDQEREELVVLYRSKGFDGQLLNDIVDTLMADNDRLLKVMLEEELGLSLEAYDHPLKQAAGAFLGSFIAIAVFTISYLLFPDIVPIFASAIVLICGAVLSANYVKNRVTDAIIWNLAIGGLACAITYFVLRALLKL